MRILLVDDERDFCNTTAAVLKRDGHEVVCAYSEAEGSELLCQRGREFDVAVLDMYMEEDDSGLRLVRLVDHLKLPTIPIVLTGRGTDSNKVESKKAGAYRYVRKGSSDQNKALVRAVNEAQRFQMGRAAAGRAAEHVKAADQTATRLERVFREGDNPAE
jgi:DNA-binding NtrC family response regulator